MTGKAAAHMFPQEESHTTCDNYHGIALLSIPNKIFSRAILNQLQPYAELLHGNQCGFRQSRGCADELFSLQVLMEKAMDFCKPIYICFIDFRKSYDSEIPSGLCYSVLWHSHKLFPSIVLYTNFWLGGCYQVLWEDFR